MDIIFRHVRGHWFLAIVAPLLVFVETWAELKQPDLMATIVDKGILGSEQSVIVGTGVEMLVIILVGVVCGLLSIYAAGKVSYSLGAGLRSEVYGRVAHLSFSDIDRLETSSLITRLGDDVNRIQGVVQQSMRLLFRAPIMFGGAVIMALMIDVDISIIIIGIMIIAFAFVIGLMRKTLDMFMRQQVKRDKLTSVVQEILVGVRVTKAYTNEEIERERFAKANNDFTEQAIGVGKYMACMMPIISLALNIGTLLIIYVGAGEVAIGNMKVGGIMAAINYLAQIQIALMMAQHVIMGISQAKASVSRIKEVLATKTEDEVDSNQDGKSSAKFINGDIEFRGVSFAYTPDGPRQLEDINLKIGKGKTLAVMGETGSGKSTLVNLLARFYDPTEGAIYIGGEKTTDIAHSEIRSHIGVVLQTSVLFSGTIRENLAMGRTDATDDEIMAAADIADIADFISQQPEGLGAKVEQGGKNLSGGQRQRLSIARTLIMRPDIIVLDDSLCALDNITESRVRQRLAEMPATKIIVSQRMSSISQADHIVALQAGRILAQGSHEEMMKDCTTYRETYLAQTR